MVKISEKVLRNLSTIMFIMIYVAMVIIHLVSDSFILSDQFFLILLMLPFLFIGLSLDYILRHNKVMKTWYRVIIQLLPLGIFIMIFISSTMYYGEGNIYTVFDYLFWFFISLPFFLASYQKDALRQRILHSLIGAGAILVIYMYLSTQTKLLDKNYGAMLIVVSYFCMLYAASGVKRFPYIGLALGILNAVAMLFFRYVPFTQAAKMYGWEYDINGKIDMIIIFSFVICILVRIYEVRITKDMEISSSITE